MSINLALILTALTVISGIVVLINKFVWKIDDDDDNVPDSQATLVEYSRAFFPVLLFVLVIRSFVFEPFRIPSDSMLPTLMDGDFIFVTKYSYGLRLPVIETKIIETGQPERGDVAVFRLPRDPSTHYIKRVVGLPGDVIEYRRHRLFINGEEIQMSEHPDYTPTDLQFIEYLGDREHRIQIMRPQNRTGDGRYVIGEGQYFMMGDNRDNSIDSRFLQVGIIDETHLVGEATRIWLNFNLGSWPKWERIGDKIQ